MTPEAKVEHVFTLLVQSVDRLRTMTPDELAETLHTAHLDVSDALYDLRRQMDDIQLRMRHATEALETAHAEYEFAKVFGWADRAEAAWQTAMYAL
jgi:hypothetical protein